MLCIGRLHVLQGGHAGAPHDRSFEEHYSRMLRAICVARGHYFYSYEEVMPMRGRILFPLGERVCQHTVTTGAYMSFMFCAAWYFPFGAIKPK